MAPDANRTSGDVCTPQAICTSQEAAPASPVFTRTPPHRTHKPKRIAVVTMGVKLGDETRGYTRFRFLSELLVSEGFTVDLITSSFQHWEKQHRDCSKICYQDLPYSVVFIDEPGYHKNLDLGRIRSHRIAAKNLRAHFERAARAYDLIYAEIPPNDVARVCAEVAHDQGIPFVADINDLWPEAMRMVVNIPVISSLTFYPFARDAKRVYQLLSGAVGTSDEYAARPAQDRVKPYPRATVYVGSDLAAFDAGADRCQGEIKKPDCEVWVAYAGTLGASYDVATLIEAAASLEHERIRKAAALSEKLAQRRMLEEVPAFAKIMQQDDRNNDRSSWCIRQHARTMATALSPCSTTLTFGPTLAPPPVRVKILGDGPDREKLEKLAYEKNAPVDFLGYLEYDRMAAYLRTSDIVVNSLVKSAAQSIVTKIGDYLASGNPLINTGSSPEFRKKVSTDGLGLNVEAENASALADAIARLAGHASLRKIMGMKARIVAEREFDQRQSYLAIVNLIRNLA